MSASARPFSGGPWLDEAPPEPEASLLLSVSGDGRYLQDGDGNPFLVWGVSAWCVTNQNTIAEQNTRLDTEAANGVNALLVMAITTYADNSPNDDDNTAPLNTPGDFSTANATFIAKLVSFVDRAAERGIVCFIAPAWDGYDGNQGFFDEMQSSGAADCQAWGEALGAALVNRDNIVWVFGGDRPPPVTTTYSQAVATGVLSQDNRHLSTWHFNFEASDSQSVTPIDINGCYEWSGVKAQVADQYGNDDGPCIVLEALYELNDDFGYTSQVGRAATLETMLVGAKGFFFGNEGTWHGGSTSSNLGVQSQGHPYDLTSTDRLEFANARGLFQGKAWHLLAPNTLNSGNGTFALTPSGNYGVIYSPSGDQVLDRTKMSGSFTARYYDITSGTFTAVSGSPFTNSGTVTFNATTALGNNSRGATDYAILLEAT